MQHGGVSMVYDGDGNRVSKTSGGITTKYLVDTNNLTGYAQVLDELTNSTADPNTFAVARTYTYGLDLISQTQPIAGVATTSYYGYDGHGSVRQLTNSAGEVTDTYTYDAFGNLLERTGSRPNLYLYAGEQFDPELGLYYNRARYLDVKQGRFWGMDEYGGNGFEPSSLHKYAYAANQPVTQADPSGNASAAEQTTAAGGSQTLDGMAAEADAVALRAFSSIFSRAVYAGAELVYSGPTLLMRAVAALTALGIGASAVLQVFQSPGELPDVAASRGANGGKIILYRDVDGTSPSNFKWRGKEKEPDGLSFFETPFNNAAKKFSVGFNAEFVGNKLPHVPGGFREPELLGIPIIYTPEFGSGHWSVPIDDEQTAQAYQERFTAAARRIKSEQTNWLVQP